jgi:hypothetical protein
MSSKYAAYYVDLYGVAHASYSLTATDDEQTKSEARNLLGLHPSIEVWQGARWVARLVRESARLRGH